MERSLTTLIDDLPLATTEVTRAIRAARKVICFRPFASTSTERP